MPSVFLSFLFFWLVQVSNPSILFLDEPTSGLDSRAAQIVIRGVENIVSTGRR